MKFHNSMFLSSTVPEGTGIDRIRQAQIIKEWFTLWDVLEETSYRGPTLPKPEQDVSDKLSQL